jgi:hypothetical protein
VRRAVGMSDSTYGRADVEAALLARGAVRRGRHLRFACVAHPDEHPSADFDPAQGVWVCRSCHVGGGARDLARRLGLEAARPSQSGPVPRVPRPPPGIAREDWIPAWTAIVDEARRQDRRLAPHRDVVRITDWLRPRHQAVADARGLASALGEDDPGAWRLLRLASRVATTIAAVEAELDLVRRHVA